MKLIQKSDFKNFYLPTGNSKFMVFSADTANAEFDFEQAFSLYTFNFLLIFHKNDNVIINNTLKQALLNKVKDGSRIYWIDKLGITKIDQCQFIPFSLNTTDRYTIGFGSDGETQILLKSVKFGQNNPATISYNTTSSVLMFKVNDAEVHSLNANKTDRNQYNSFIIPLAHQQNIFGFDSKATNNNVGSICFLSLRSSKNSIQPTTSLLSPNNQNENILFNYKYFLDESYSQNVDLLAIIYPTSNFDNKDSNYQSYIELFAQQDFATCFIDEYGKNFKIPRGSSLVNKIAFVNPDASSPNSRNFFFMPIAGQTLDLQSNGKLLLLGNSGTERQDKTKLVFEEYDEVLFSENTEGIVETSKYANSITAIPKLPKEVTYYLDSEKAPQFNNEEKLNPNQNTEKREEDYAPIVLSTIAKDTQIPIIPTLSFKGNTHLEELEKILVKYRLQKINKSHANLEFLNSSNFITPQGFLKSGTQLDYISHKQQKTKNGSLNLLDAEKSNYRFTIKNVDFDFNISISKEDVFFVTTPSLLKEAAFKAHFDIFFSIQDFDIDLILKNLTTSTDSERIIIFKYSRYTVEELLADTSKWSNYGKFKKRDWSTINGNIKNEFSSFEKKFNSGTNKDYDYIVQSVYRDRNWNGVFILNIPIANGEDLPPIFTGLTASQKLQPNEQGNEKIALQTPLKFQYVAFPVNKTFINDDGLIEIKSTSYFGLIDYDILESNPVGETPDYNTVHQYFKDGASWQFVMSKLLVRFENSEIRNFNSYAFVKVPKLFEDNVQFDGIELTHKDPWQKGDIDNLFRLKGNYQKNSAGTDEFIFDIEGTVDITFTENTILRQITIVKAAFSYENNEHNDFRFDLDGNVFFNKDFGTFKDLLKFDSLSFKNIGLKFSLKKFQLPEISFDVSKLLVLPKVNFNGNGFFSSFPIKFNRFQVFEIKTDNSSGELYIPNFDFLNIPVPNLDLKIPGALWSFVFDFDLGTLGDIELLKKLKGEFLFGWSAKGGFKFGFKINGPSTDGLHLDLFGAMKLDIERVDLCSFDNAGSKTYFLRLIDARLTIFGKELPSKDYFDFNGIIYARPGDKIAWFIAATKKTQPPTSPDTLALGVGQRVGPQNLQNFKKVDDVIKEIRDVFNKDLDPCNTTSGPVQSFYNPDRNWLVASEDFIPKAWRNIFDMKFVFNDPSLYGIYIQIVGYLEVDILYKKLSENLGVYSAELQLDPVLRNQDFGGVAVTFPNLGVDIYTNGNFKVDIGYPKSESDWSRSCLIQIRPFVGWAGFYFSKLKTASISLFSNYLNTYPELRNTNILQAGFAFRIGIGAYKQESMYYVGASISVYGIMEGAFAFNKGEDGLEKFIPDHFALRGRVGAIAELIGYVDFKVIKASIHIILRVEFGMLLAVIYGEFQPVPLYIEGEVRVSIRYRVGCFKIFRKKFCIYIRLSFKTQVRFPYTLGGNNSNKLLALSDASKKMIAASSIKVEFGEIPLVYIPSITKSSEGNYLIHHFAINFFGIKYDGDELIFSENNILKDHILKPIFSAILGTASKNYSELRYYFLGGKEGSSDELLDFTSFKPTLYVGYDDEDENFLKNTFKLRKDATIDEISEFKNTIKDDPCSSSQKCPFRIIPIPVGSAIKVNHKNGMEFETGAAGFKIKWTGIFKDNTGNDIDIETSVRKAIKDSPEAYTLDDIRDIEKHFDGYMTQFLERQNDDKLYLDTVLKDKDLREDAIIPEYFKLIGLLTLETCHNKFIDADKGLEEDEEIIISSIENPTISLDGDNLVFTCFKQKTNDITTKIPVEIKIKIDSEALEKIIGQLNYFYNNGLRLPDVTNSSTLTKAYYDLIKQTSIFQNVNPEPTYANSDIVFSMHDDSIPISLKVDMFGDDTVLKDFTSKASEILTKNLNDLNNDISQISVDSPYQLIDVKLSIPNSNINTDNTAYRFFEIPKKIQQNLNSEKTNLNVHIVSNSNVKNDAVLNYVSCSNMEVSIKPHSIDGVIKSLELVNVFIDDLNLIHKVKENPDVIKTISIYLKEVNDQNIIYKPLVKLGEEANTKLIKTNLSPRTHPPVIDNETAKALTIPSEKYVANLTETHDFIRILWEGVTTNNGGFFLVESDDSDLFSAIPKNTKDDIKIVFSFESEKIQPFYAFNNFIKVYKDVISSRTIFDELDKGSHSLYAEVLSEDGKNVKEYHSKIPVHCFGFTVTRNKPENEVFHQYLPLEFDITNSQGETILSKDQILPLMPQHEKDKKGKSKLKPNGEIDDSKWIYSHITPILKLDKAGLNRYDSINSNLEYTINFGLRDIFGFRAIKLTENIENYQHKYFDKLVPINAWPFISISYWFKEYQNNELTFELKIKTFEGNLKGQHDDEILESLNTIIAQISDKNVAVELDKDFIYSPTELKEKLVHSLNFVKTNLTNSNPKEAELKVDFKLKVNSELKIRLNPTITISRKVPEDLFVHVPNPNVWEYDTIKSISTEINIPEDSTIKLLNDAIHKSPYVLGISSDHQKQKITYLLNKDFLQFEIKESTPLQRSSYFAIKPYSNKLWSGNYQSHKKDTAGNIIKGEKQDFTSIDLDKGLSMILSKIDDLLTPSNIKNLTLDYVEQLVLCKKLLVEEELKNKTANIDTDNDTNQVELQQEFRNLLLESLDKFYQYDGIVRLTPTNSNLEKLKNHRLSITLAKQTGYTIQSSKIDFTAEVPQWFILFDQIMESEYVEFDIIPKLTHIEFDIQSEDSSPEIEKSTWIQLIEPQDLLLPSIQDNTISNRHSETDNKWPRILREFPAKPQIINHEAEQVNDESKSDLIWSKTNNLAEWQYKISIRDTYSNLDELKIFIKTVSLNENKSSSLLQFRDFKGCIAFWSSLFTTKTIKVELEDFIDDLGYQLSLSPLLSENYTRALSDNVNSFILRKNSGNWNIENHTPYTISSQVDHSGNLNIMVGGKGFNLFKIEEPDERIKSITSEITAYRNRDAKNDAFVYVTETVSPSSWATPHIKFFTPIKIDNDLLIQDVFIKMKEMKLPYKTTAKFLVNTADLDTEKKAKLPVIPVAQMEFKEDVLPSNNPFDTVFENYTNGYPSILVTIYNKSDESNNKNDLPIFFANNIYKPKQ